MANKKKKKVQIIPEPKDIKPEDIDPDIPEPEEENKDNEKCTRSIALSTLNTHVTVSSDDLRDDLDKIRKLVEILVDKYAGK